MRITLHISPEVANLLAVLDARGDAQTVIERLIDHAQQGVYRPGSWERSWLYPAFGNGWTENLEPGDPYGRPGGEDVFQRPMNPRYPTEGMS